ncbi:hypothetical protein [Burkholderia sp. BDU5]|uniref:hypothetical protein n=1 Tax=Burkholderia sp. BDU5 TaxID=1385590 RepID=UPI0018D2565C|nr:hypothetical protein [Burkholderia sp. BDU5]
MTKRSKSIRSTAIVRRDERIDASCADPFATPDGRVVLVSGASPFQVAMRGRLIHAVFPCLRHQSAPELSLG